jgi:2-C-methyl-D-erythritol 4-phosphate cytidylyltransferase
VSGATAVIVAAGEGRRFGGPKAFALLGGRPLLDRCVEAFESHEGVEAIVLVLPGARVGEDFARRFRKVVSAVAGGPRRQDSVRNGFREVRGGGRDIVLIHDGARPLAGRALISRVIDEAARSGAAVPVLPLEDTVKEVREEGVLRTHDRSVLYRAQTPQGFFYEILEEALAAADRNGFGGTDEAMLVERTGRRVAAVAGDPRNIKITTPLDLRIAEALLEA